ncbi:acyltransferase [Mesorhizobium sp. ISC25]|uniref:acyltransferase n=1 Tax=Mesorhizobium sp. ISC25 TaxID=3077335 RepID=UPI0035D76376
MKQVHLFLPTARGVFYRSTVPLFFRKVGKGTLIWGGLRLSRPMLNIGIGEDCMLGHSLFFQTALAAEITIGDRTSINTGCHLVASELIRIGSNVAIGEYVSIRDQEHRFKPASGVRGQDYKVAPVIIEENVWIGRGAYIGPGTTIRAGTIVAANSVVRGDFPPNVLLAGAPAKIRRIILQTGEMVLPPDDLPQ